MNKPRLENCPRFCPPWSCLVRILIGNMESILISIKRNLRPLRKLIKLRFCGKPELEMKLMRLFHSIQFAPGNFLRREKVCKVSNASMVITIRRNGCSSLNEFDESKTNDFFLTLIFRCTLRI